MDDLQIKTRALSSLLKDIQKGKFDFEHPLQRKSGQWNKYHMSRLIDSAIRLYPIFPALVEENNDGIYGVIDGKQRLTIFESFVNDEFALHKSLLPINIDGVEYILSGKKYSKLDEAVKDRLNSRELQLYIMRNATDEDIREIFARINSSKGLSNTQRRTTVENEEMRKVIYSLTTHPFLEKVLTKAQRKRDLDKDLIRETLMLIETNEGKDYTSFKNNHINDFITEYQEDIKYEKINLLKQALDKLDENFAELKVNAVSIPMIFYASYKVLKDKKSFSKLVEVIQEFIQGYEDNIEYKQFCQSGTSSSESVNSRLNYWKKLLKLNGLT